MKVRDRQIILKLLSEIDIAHDMMDNTKLEDFLQNEMLKRAICMTVVNIGELVKNITDDTRNAYQQVPWKAIAGFRDIAAHKYQTLKMEDVYQTIQLDFPSLKMQLLKILEREEEL